MEPSTREAIAREIARLDEAGRRRVLDYARSLSEQAPSGVPGAALLALAGTVPGPDMAEIEAAIAEGCEQVNPGGW